MASGTTTVPGHATAPPWASNLATTVRRSVPFRPVILPWLIARMLVVPAIVFGGPADGVEMGKLIWMDGQWFRLIALDWYERPYVDGLWSEYPFFPLFPALGGGLMKLGASPTLALAGISWVASLVAMAGLYRLAVRHLTPSVAPWAPWFLAIGPGAVTMVLGYADSLFLAATLWAFVLAEDRRWVAAGVLAAVATASRPNGFITVVALVVAVVIARAGRRAAVAIVLPATVVLAAWCGYLWWATGDPLVFWSSKEAWSEISIGTFFADPFLPRHRAALFHVAFFLALAVPYLWRVARQPIHWTVFVVLGVLPPLVLGVEGLARYAVMAFPMPLAAADVIAGRSRPLAAAYLTVTAAAMAYLGVMVVRRMWLP